MPKVGKQPKSKPKGLQVGDVVTVVTQYTVKRLVDSGLVTVEDDYGDRVLTFRKEELQKVQ